MNNLIETYRPVFSPADEGSAAGGTAAGGGTPPAASAAAAPDGGVAPPPPAAAAAAPDFYKPDGLPEHLQGKTDRETIDNLKKATDGYRQKDAQNQVPEDPAAYKAFDLEKVAPEIKPFIGALANDPHFDAVAAKAKELGISVPNLQALTEVLYASGAAGGLFADMIDPVAERQALIPAGFEGKPQAEQDKAIDARVKGNEDFINLLAKNSVGVDGKMKAGGLSKEIADHAIFMLGADAKGNQFIEYMRSQLSAGNQPFTGGTGGGDTLTPEGLRARAKMPENIPGTRQYDEKSYKQLQDDYQKLYS